MNTENLIDAYSNLSSDESGVGLVYLLKRGENTSVIKIGHTTKTAEIRASNYTDGEWLVHKNYSMPIWLAKMTERAAHAQLNQFWLDPKLTGGSASEIFTCSVEDGDVAIQVAYIEQLERALRLLGIPDAFVKVVLKDRGLSSDTSISSLELRLDAIRRDGLKENEILTRKIQLLETDQLKSEEHSDRISKLIEAEKKALLEKIAALETECSKFKNYIQSSINDFDKEIEMLENIAGKKINLKDFEMLRDGFRRAVEIIRKLRINDQYRA